MLLLHNAFETHWKSQIGQLVKYDESKLGKESGNHEHVSNVEAYTEEASTALLAWNDTETCND